MSKPLSARELITILLDYPQDAPVYLCLPDVEYLPIDNVTREGTRAEIGEVPFPLLRSSEAEEHVEYLAEQTPI